MASWLIGSMVSIDVGIVDGELVGSMVDVEVGVMDCEYVVWIDRWLIGMEVVGVNGELVG